MFKREFHVKRGTGAFLTKGMFFLIMLLLSIFCCLSPKLYNITDDYAYYFTVIGFSASLFFSFMFVFNVYRGICPFDAVILTDDGIYDFVNHRKGIFIDWANVSSVKVFGSQKAPLLGVELYDAELLAGTIKGAVGREISTNVQSGLPAIIIKQSELAPKLSQILPAFNDFISATRPIPIVNSLPDSDLSNDDPMLVVSEHIDKNAENMYSFPDENDDYQPRSIRVAKKEMQEVFILPGDIPTGSSFSPSMQSYEIKSKNDVPSVTVPEKKVSSVPTFNEFVMETVQQPSAADKTIDNAKTKEMPAVDLAKLLEETKKAAPSQPEIKEDAAKQKKQEEIKSLDDLLSSFSVPTITKTKDD